MLKSLTIDMYEKEWLSLDKSNNVHIAKNIKVIEWLKAEIVDQVGALFKGLYHGKETFIIDSLASLIISIYVLARRVGIPFHKIDKAVVDKISENKTQGHEIEEWYGDLSVLEQYVRANK